MSAVSKPRVPEGLRDLMKDLTREILKEKPADIYDFAENYFQSRLPEKENYAVNNFEHSIAKYDFSYIKNPQLYQLPVTFVYSIIPESVTNLIKDLIKAVLREQPQNLCEFAVEYFHHLQKSTKEPKSISKEINYTTYENYFTNKERFLFTPYVKCSCGRTLSGSYKNSLQTEQLSPIESSESAIQSKCLLGMEGYEASFSGKYMAAIYKIQKYFRLYLKKKSNGLSSNNKRTEYMKESFEQSDLINPLVPQLEINEIGVENNSEEVSYTSASTALLSANEPGQELPDGFMSEMIQKQPSNSPEYENDTKTRSLGFKIGKNYKINDDLFENGDRENDIPSTKREAEETTQEIQSSFEMLNHTVLESSEFKKDPSDVQNNNNKSKKQSQLDDTGTHETSLKKSKKNNKNTNENHSTIHPEANEHLCKIEEKTYRFYNVEKEDKNANFGPDEEKTEIKSNPEILKTEIKKEDIIINKTQDIEKEIKTIEETSINSFKIQSEREKGKQTVKENMQGDDKNTSNYISEVSKTNVVKTEHNENFHDQIEKSVKIIETAKSSTEKSASSNSGLTGETNDFKDAILYFETKRIGEATDLALSEDEINLRENFEPQKNFIESNLDLQMKMEPQLDNIFPSTEKGQIYIKETEVLKDSEYDKKGNDDNKLNEFSIKSRDAGETEDQATPPVSTSKLNDYPEVLNKTPKSLHIETNTNDIAKESEKHRDEPTTYKTKKYELSETQSNNSEVNNIQIQSIIINNVGISECLEKTNEKEQEDIIKEDLNGKVNKLKFQNSELETSGLSVQEQDIFRDLNEVNPISKTLSGKKKENTDLDFQVDKINCASEINKTIKNEELFVSGSTDIIEKDVSAKSMTEPNEKDVSAKSMTESNEKDENGKNENNISKDRKESIVCETHNSKLYATSAPSKKDNKELKLSSRKTEVRDTSFKNHSLVETFEKHIDENEKITDFSKSNFENYQNTNSLQSENELGKGQDETKNISLDSDNSDLLEESTLKTDCHSTQIIKAALQNEGPDESKIKNANGNKFVILNKISQKQVQEHDTNIDLKNNGIEHETTSHHLMETEDTHGLDEIPIQEIQPNERLVFSENQNGESRTKKEIVVAKKKDETTQIFKQNEDDITGIINEASFNKNTEKVEEFVKDDKENKDNLSQTNVNMIRTDDSNKSIKPHKPSVISKENEKDDSDIIITEIDTQSKLQPKMLQAVKNKENVSKGISEDSSRMTTIKKLKENISIENTSSNLINITANGEQNEKEETKNTSSKTLTDFNDKTKEISSAIFEVPINVITQDNSEKVLILSLTEEDGLKEQLLKHLDGQTDYIENDLTTNTLVELVDKNLKNSIKEQHKAGEATDVENIIENNDQNTFPDKVDIKKAIKRQDNIFQQLNSDEKYETKTEKILRAKNKEPETSEPSKLEDSNAESSNLKKSYFEHVNEDYKTSHQYVSEASSSAGKDNKTTFSLHNQLENLSENELSEESKKFEKAVLDLNYLTKTDLNGRENGLKHFSVPNESEVLISILNSPTSSGMENPLTVSNDQEIKLKETTVEVEKEEQMKFSAVNVNEATKNINASTPNQLLFVEGSTLDSSQLEFNNESTKAEATDEDCSPLKVLNKANQAIQAISMFQKSNKINEDIEKEYLNEEVCKEKSSDIIKFTSDDNDKYKTTHLSKQQIRDRDMEQYQENNEREIKDPNELRMLDQNIIQDISKNILSKEDIQKTNSCFVNEVTKETSSCKEFKEKEQIYLDDHTFTAVNSIKDQLETKLRTKNEIANKLDRSDLEVFNEHVEDAKDDKRYNNDKTIGNVESICKENDDQILNSESICSSPKVVEHVSKLDVQQHGQSLVSTAEDKINLNFKGETLNEDIKLNKNNITFKPDNHINDANKITKTFKSASGEERRSVGDLQQTEFHDDANEYFNNVKENTENKQKDDLQLNQHYEKSERYTKDDEKVETFGKHNNETDTTSLQQTESNKTEAYRNQENNVDEDNTVDTDSRSINKSLATAPDQDKQNDRKYERNIKTSAQQDLVHVKENSERADTTEPTLYEDNDKINYKETKLNIGNQTQVTYFIGNQNLTIDRIRNFNNGLIGSISGQRFAETHLRSFWKEYLMNNCEPLSEYKYIENEQNQFKKQGQNSYPDYITIGRKQDYILEEQITDEKYTSISSCFKSEKTSPGNNPPKNIERLPGYFYGAPDLAEQTTYTKYKFFKEPTSFIIPLDEPKKYHFFKTDEIVDTSNSKNNSVNYNKKNNVTKLNLTGAENAEPLLDAETSAELFKDLTNDLKDEVIITPEPILQTIDKFYESQKPNPIKILESIDEEFLINREKRNSGSEGTSWTTESKDENSFISDEFFEDQKNNNDKFPSDMPTTFEESSKKQGGIYEFPEDYSFDTEIEKQDEQTKEIFQSPSMLNYPLEEELKVSAANIIQNFFRQYKRKTIKNDFAEVSNHHSPKTIYKSAKTKHEKHDDDSPTTKIYSCKKGEALRENRTNLHSSNTIDSSKQVNKTCDDKRESVRQENNETESFLSSKSNFNRSQKEAHVVSNKKNKPSITNLLELNYNITLKEEFKNTQISKCSESIIISETNEDLAKKSDKNEKCSNEMVKFTGNFKIENDTAPRKEDIHLIHSIKDQAASKIQNAFRKFLKQKSNKETNKIKLTKSSWFIGDEQIFANESLIKPTSEIPFEETEAYIELTSDPAKYLVSSSSSLEYMDASNFSRSPTAPVTDSYRRNSVESINNRLRIIFKDTVTANQSDVDDKADTLRTNLNERSSNENDCLDDGREKPYCEAHLHQTMPYKNISTLKYINIIDQFINSERQFSEIVNHENPKPDMFVAPSFGEISEILSELTNSQQEIFNPVGFDECQGERCIKKQLSCSCIEGGEETIAETSGITDTSSSFSEVDDAEDSLSMKTFKLQKPDMAISRMQLRRDSTTKISSIEIPKDYNFDEPFVVAMDNLDTDEEGIMVKKLQREETIESSTQSDSDIIIGSEKNNKCNKVLESFDINETFPLKGSLKRVYTIAGESDAKLLLKNVTIDDSIKYIEPPDFELNSGNSCLDIEMTENIRRKMMAFSMSEADSDCFDKNTTSISRGKYDDFNVSTALIENNNSSTETESTIVSAVTKIQAVTRGFLIRKRVGKTNAASSFKSITSNKHNQASFGNAAISESLEKLVQESAAKKIQMVYRLHLKKRHFKINQIKNHNLSSEIAISQENPLAQKRSIMLQRSVALQNNSSPEADDNSSKNGSSNPNSTVEEIKNSLSAIESKNSIENATSYEFDKCRSSGKTTDEIRAKKIKENKLKWFKMRQNSMPVQIDSEVLRVIPKYMRKKIKSADGEKKQSGRQMFKD